MKMFLPDLAWSLKTESCCFEARRSMKFDVDIIVNVYVIKISGPENITNLFKH